MAYPTRSRWEINIAGALPLRQDRSYQNIRAKHVGIFDPPSVAIRREIIEQWPNYRRAALMGGRHQLPDVGSHSFAEPEVFLQDAVDFITEAPELVWCAADTFASAPV
jgi:hypothetical protein